MSGPLMAGTDPAQISSAGADQGTLATPGAGLVDRRMPPVAELAVLSMALVIAGGIYMAAHLPGRPPLGLAEVLLVVSAAPVLANMALLARLRDFAWPSFWLVTKWSLVAYLVITGILEYIFVFDGTRGSTLAVMSCMLAVFAVNVPLLLGFSVARYQPPPEHHSDGWTNALTNPAD
jgi:hypothetical protein